jgi:hypothetical protein
MLRGDLDAIALKCLAKDPAQRYATGWELAEDLQRYLSGQPVQCRADELSYRVTRWVRRVVLHR